jgi:hypothetical protein
MHVCNFSFSPSVCFEDEDAHLVCAARESIYATLISLGNKLVYLALTRVHLGWCPSDMAVERRRGAYSTQPDRRLIVTMMMILRLPPWIERRLVFGKSPVNLIFLKKIKNSKKNYS